MKQIKNNCKTHKHIKLIKCKLEKKEEIPTLINIIVASMIRHLAHRKIFYKEGKFILPFALIK